MGGKSNKSKNKGKASSSAPVSVAEPDTKPVISSVLLNGDANGVADSGGEASAVEEAVVAARTEVTEAETKQVEDDVRLYPVSIKTQSGEKLELQLSPGDSVLDVRQFLLDAPETCFFTCYDLFLHTKDGSAHPLEDYNEISEVADITTGDCSLEMVAALYDARSIRSHVSRARDLLSLSTLQTSLATLLPLQYETNEQKTADAVKAEASELDGLIFMEDNTGSLQNLMTSSCKEIKCMESIVYSSFNPPPNYRRLTGDLIYMDVVTLEGNKFCITGTTKAFYVNSSKGDVLDPGLAKPGYEASTLIGLLQKISTKFKKGFREILDKKASAHPFENVQCLLSPNSWLGVYPIPDHKRDAARAEDSMTLSYGSELIGMQRDWNEELQSCREFPHTTLQERIFRDRALYKVTCDFVDAARNGAIGVINKCIPPINPTDPECFHMYVHNNIFFSFAVDADLGHISNDGAMTVTLKFGAEHCEDSTSLPVASAKASTTVNGTIDDSTTQISGSEEHNSTADRSSDIATEAQIADNEQATYASANNDLKGTKAYQEADVPGLYNLAMAIIDYRGYRVVAQSIIPGILQGDKSDSLLYGSVDNGKKICWNESFHSKVVEASKHLHLKEHSVLDESGNIVKLAAPVECKGIVGSDDRHYLLDLMRMTPRDANYSGPGSRFCILRPELVASFCEVEAAERSLSKPKTGELPKVPVSQNVPGTDLEAAAEVNSKTSETCVSGPAASSTSYEVLLNPNVYTEFKLADSEEEVAADVACVRKAGSYLIDVVIPKFVQDICALEVSPMDGQTLTEALHAHGINVRYLGKVANLTRNLPHLWDMCSSEIIVRSAKHILKDVLRESQDHDLGQAISHFLNCFIGHIVSSDTKGSPNNVPLSQKKSQETQSLHKHVNGKMTWSHGAAFRKKQSAYMVMTSEGLWSYIKEFAKVKYQFELPEDAQLQVKKVYVVRNLCQKVGLTIAARKYDLDASAPFQTSDILNLQPVVKHSFPVCLEAKNLIETGKARLAEGLLNEAYTLFSEAFSLLQQITGPMHCEVANCCRYLAMILYHAGDMPGAIAQQLKELIINEHCLGLDHPDTAHSYGNMALFYHGLNKTELALRHMSRTLLLLSLSSGSDHPDVAATFINVAMMYQDIGNMNTALRYLQEALKKNERLLGQEHIQTAVCYHALAIAFNCMGAYKLSIQHEKKTYDILLKQLGEEDSRTRDSENWMNTFKVREQQANALKQKGLPVNPTSEQNAIDILKAHPDLMRAFQAVAGNASPTSLSKFINAALLGEAAPRGKGVDERAARATLEVRKKAAAKGLPIRANGVPAGMVPVAQLRNIVGSGANATALASETNKETSPTPNAGADGCKDINVSAENRDQDPVGLGTGLASLDSKKPKSKSKATK